MSAPPPRGSRSDAIRAYTPRVDFGKTSDDYARFRPGPPASFYDRINRLIPLRGCRALDLGTGTGLAAIELAARGTTVAAIDISAPQIEAAKRAAESRALQIDFRVAPAETTGFGPSQFDLVLALQCWHWFDHARAAAEAMRLLWPGGAIIVASFDYLTGRSPVAKRTEDLILKYNPTWPMANGTGVYTRPLFDLPAAGFTDLEQFSYEHIQPFTHEAWRGRMRACNGVAASLPPDQVAAFDADLAALLSSEFPAEPLEIIHRMWVVWARKPA